MTEENISVSNCNCDFCKADKSLTTAAAAAALTTRSKKQAMYVTDRALMRVGHDKNLVTQRVEPVHQFFSASYMDKKNYTYEQACDAAANSIAGTFSAPGSRIRHYSAYSIKAYNFSNMQGAQGNSSYRLAGLLQTDKGRRAFLERKPLLEVYNYTLRAAEIPVNHEARNYFRDRDYAVATTLRSTVHQKDRVYFLHYNKESVVPGDHIILPLDLKTASRFSNRMYIDEQRDLEPTPEIKGLSPVYEMLGEKEQHLLHPTREHPGPYNESTRSLPIECKKWDCPICFHMQQFGRDIDYKAFLGG